MTGCDMARKELLGSFPFAAPARGRERPRAPLGTRHVATRAGGAARRSLVTPMKRSTERTFRFSSLPGPG